MIGILHSGSEKPNEKQVQALLKKLDAQGVQYLPPKYADGDSGELEGLAGELIGNREVEVIVSAGGPEPALLLQKLTAKSKPDLPIVFTTVADPVLSKLVKTLAKPSYNLTGMAGQTSELDPRRLEILDEFIPATPGKDREFGILMKSGRDHGDDQYANVKKKANDLGLKLRPHKVDTEDGIKKAFGQHFTGCLGVVVTADSFFYNLRDTVIPSANNAKLPTIYQWCEFVSDGGYLSFGTDIVEAYEKAAEFVFRILGVGGFPKTPVGDIPVAMPSNPKICHRSATNLQVPEHLKKHIAREFK
jgi:putative tryptophan/tyrosine transport system substrate-binding protein